MLKIYFKFLYSQTYQLCIIAFLILFISSSIRHELFQSTTYDLGIVDNILYLISHGKEPISPLLKYHIMGDHAAWIFYLLAIPYKIFPSVYWLFLIQALALVIGAILLVNLANLPSQKNIILILVYFLYPVVFNANLFDFHTDTLAIPLIFSAILTARKNNILGYFFSIIFILSCKEIFSLTVIFLGLWLYFCENRKIYGLIAISSGIAWFIISTQLIIPFYSNGYQVGISRYSYLGGNVTQVVKNIFFEPVTVLKGIFSFRNLIYLIYLFSPIFWAISLRTLSFLLPAIPAIFLNLLADYTPQKSLALHYSLPILPFLMLTVAFTLQNYLVWLKKTKLIVIWSIITFLILAKYPLFFLPTKYLNSLDTWRATKDSISLIKDDQSVLTWAQAVPHLSERNLITMLTDDSKLEDLSNFNDILLNLRHPGWMNTNDKILNLVLRLQNDSSFKLSFKRDDVFLFQKK